MSDSPIVVHGIGAVSPAGWGMNVFRDAIAAGAPTPTKEIVRPAWEKKLTVRQVPPAQPRPAFLGNPRLRRTSPIAQYAVAAGLEALATDAAEVTIGSVRLGIVFCVMSGCVNYSRRFYDEALRDPATASPLVFPETVFNAPSSHLAALLGTHAINYTLVGDPGTFLQGLALGADWLISERVDGCLVIGAEEVDWITSDAYRRFERKIILSDGAGAVYLKRSPAVDGAMLNAVTESHLFLRNQSRACAAERMCNELTEVGPAELLCDGTQELKRLDAAENAAWSKISSARLSVKSVFGEGLMAAAAWQCVAAIDALQRKQFRSANVSIVGCNQQAIGAQFIV